MNIPKISDIKAVPTSTIFMVFSQGQKCKYECGCNMAAEAFGIVVGERMRERLAPEGRLFTVRVSWKDIVAFHHPKSESDGCRIGYESAERCGSCAVEALRKGVIDCCLCAGDIIPGDGVVFRRRYKSEHLSRSTSVLDEKRRCYIGCTRPKCAKRPAEAVWDGKKLCPMPRNQIRNARPERERDSVRP